MSGRYQSRWTDDDADLLRRELAQYEARRAADVAGGPEPARNDPDRLRRPDDERAVGREAAD